MLKLNHLCSCLSVDTWHMICQHVDSTWHIEPCWPRKTMKWMSVPNTFCRKPARCFVENVFLFVSRKYGPQMDPRNETKPSGASLRWDLTQWFCTFPLEIHIIHSFFQYIGKVRVGQSKNNVIWALLHDSSSSISRASCNKTQDYLALLTCYWAGPGPLHFNRHVKKRK